MSSWNVSKDCNYNRKKLQKLRSASKQPTLTKDNTGLMTRDRPGRWELELNYKKAPSNKMSNGQLQNFLKTKLESAGEVFILQSQRQNPTGVTVWL